MKFWLDWKESKEKERKYNRGRAQSVERLTEEQVVAGSILGTGPTLKVLKWLRNKGTPFALQMAIPSSSLYDHVLEWRSRL